MSIPAPYGQQHVGMLTPSKHTHCEVTNRGRKINFKEPLPLIRVFVQADPA
jgi:hypothetical protein